jgi:hypothetical protein
VDIVHERCAALDVSKRDAKVCVRMPGKRRGTFTHEVTTWGATTSQVLALREFLVAERVTVVVMEATGDYWKPFYPARRRPGRVAGQRPAREEPARAQDGRLRRAVACATRCARPGARITRAARAGARTTRSNSHAHPFHLGALA